MTANRDRSERFWVGLFAGALLAAAQGCSPSVTPMDGGSDSGVTGDVSTMPDVLVTDAPMMAPDAPSTMPDVVDTDTPITEAAVSPVLDPIPCNGMSCTGICLRRPPPVDSGTFVPPVPPADSGSGAWCASAPPAGCEPRLCNEQGCRDVPACAAWAQSVCWSFEFLTGISSQPASRYGSCVSGGRSTAGTEARLVDAFASATEQLAQMALLEHEAVAAFDRMVRELEHHGAPARLIDAARTAREDEVRHADAMRALANARGAQVSFTTHGSLPVRALDEIALENAREGCVRETYGALLAHFQRENARDRAVAAAMEPIAREELAHARLSWELHAWMRARLSREAQRRVDETLHTAVHELTHAESDTPPWAHELGLPDEAQQRALLDTLARELWSHAGRARRALSAARET